MLVAVLQLNQDQSFVEIPWASVVYWIRRISLPEFLKFERASEPSPFFSIFGMHSDLQQEGQQCDQDQREEEQQHRDQQKDE